MCGEHRNELRTEDYYVTLSLDRGQEDRHENSTISIRTLWHSADGSLWIPNDDCGELSRGPLQAYAHPEDPAARYIKVRPYVQDPSSGECFGLLQKWKAGCLQSHDSCPKRPHRMPTRVIEVSHSNGEMRVCLCHTKDLGLTEFYTTLSYCWGGDQSQKMTKASLHEWASGFALTHLPKTLQDAARVTFKLNIRYLWIDSLCIVQDDPEDVQREIAQMADIYRNSFLTISAASAPSCNDGFLQDRASLIDYEDAYKLPFACRDGETGSVVAHPYFKRREFLGEPINSRGWTLQEFLLSPRLLSYGSRQTQWLCREAELVDGGCDSLSSINPFLPEAQSMISALNSLNDSNTVTRDRFYQVWSHVASEYSMRSLSFPSDKLLALSGIASQCADNFKDEYLAGLWRADLAHGLLWNRAGVDAPKHARPPYRAPSWSWMSIEGHIEFADMYGSLSSDSISPHFKILGVTVQLVSTTAPFGAVKGGRLQLQGRLQQVKFIEKEGGLAHPKWPTCKDDAMSSIDATEEVVDGVEIYCIEIKKRPGGLLLLPSEDGCYHRVGGFHMRDIANWETPEHKDKRIERQRSWFNDSKVSIVTIV